MNEPPPPLDWVTIWQRRLRYSLDDEFAQELADTLQLRIRTFERSTDRVLGQRSIRVGEEIVFLAIESDDFETPVMRLLGPSQLRQELSLLSAEFDAAISRLESPRRRLPHGQQHGTPIWVPFPNTVGTNAVRFVLPNWDSDAIVTWPIASSSDLPGAAGGLGLIVDSVVEATRRSEMAGGILVQNAMPLPIGVFAVVLAPGRIPVVFWEPNEDQHATAAAARLDIQSPDIERTVSFFRDVANWRSEVLRGDPLTAVLTHGGYRVGIVLEHPVTEHEVSVLSGRPQRLVHAAIESEEYATQSLPLRFPLGRRWSITDASGTRLDLAETPDDSFASSHLRRSWLHLPTNFLIALADLRTGFDLLERVLREILVAVPPPPQSEQSSSLLGVLSAALGPAASRIAGLLGDSNSPGQILEVLAAERPSVQGLVEDLGTVAHSLEDHDLIAAYRSTQLLLIRSGLLTDTPGALEESHVWQ